MKLFELHINNFKFFPEQDPNSPLLKIEGKNLLIYGENGSGKSTIYWALYTLLESAFKEKEDDVSKYFKKTGEFGLVNINSKEPHNVFIKSVLAEDGGTKVEYLISGKTEDIEAARGNSAIRESNMASDFLNYRILLRLHLIRHSEENNLFGWFEHEVFPYIIIEAISKTQSVKDYYKELRAGPEKVKDFDEIDKMIFSNPQMRGHSQEAVRKDYVKYQDYAKKVENFNKSLKEYLSKIVKRSNEILKNDFHQNFVFDLIFKFAKHNVSKDYVDWIEPVVDLSIPVYEGKKDVVKKPHSFLNEAKWSTIGLSIRFAILEDWENRPSTAQLKLLVIDDLLISLDMSNRDIVTKLLLDRYVNDYQLMILTHDRSYFNWLYFELENRKWLGKDGRWNALEMYVKENDPKIGGGFEKPIILPSKSELSIAMHHYSNFDYASAANYLRKYAENILCNWLPAQYWQDKENRDISNAKMPLSNIIDNAIKFLERISKNSDNYKELRKYVKILLNPLSHTDIGINRYKVEIKSLFNVLEAIVTFQDTIKWSILRAGGQEVEIRLTKPSTSQIFVYQFDLIDSLYLIKHAGTESISKCQVNSKKSYIIENSGKKQDDQKFEYYRNKELYEAYKEICNHEPDLKYQIDLRPQLYNINGKKI